MLTIQVLLTLLALSILGTISATKTEYNNADDDDYPDLSTYVKVLDEQSIVFNATGWVEIPIDDYDYSGSGGLEVIFENHTNSTGTGPEVFPLRS